VSARKAKLLRMAEAGSEGARAALVIAEHPGRFLGLVQFWLTVTSVIAGVALVASAAEGFSSWFSRWPAVAPWAEIIGLVAGTLVISSVMLFFGELLPKRIALANPERAAAILGTRHAHVLAGREPLSAMLGLASDAMATALGFKPEARVRRRWATRTFGRLSSAASMPACSSGPRRRWSRASCL
jgi:putative hemolysin